MRASLALFCTAGIAAALVSCTASRLATAPSGAGTPLERTRALRSDIDTIVVIYAENRAFDNLYGNFPGARNLSEVLDRDGHPLPAYHPQLDRDGSVLSVLPPSWGGVTAAGVRPVVTQQQSVGLPNAPYSIEHAFTPQSQVSLSTATVTRDLWHRFFEHQMQIDGGKNDGYAAWSDAGGLALGHYDYSRSALYALAREFVLADNFFQGAFGGSFLNHQYLICACAPEYPGADTAAAKPSIAVLEKDAAGRYLPRLKTAATPPASALDQPPTFAKSGDIAPAQLFWRRQVLRGEHHAASLSAEPQQAGGQGRELRRMRIRTIRPRCRRKPSAPSAMRWMRRGIAWAWYAGAWNAAVKDGRRPPVEMREVIYAPETRRRQSGFSAASPAVQLLTSVSIPPPTRNNARRT